MAKMKVHELAKEVGKQSKEIVAFLQEKGIEAKAAQSSVEDAAIDIVRKAFGAASAPKAEEKSAPKTEAPKAEEPAKVEAPKTAEPVKTEAPKTDAPKEAQPAKTENKPNGPRPEQKKKKSGIIFVSNPHNSKMPGQKRPPFPGNQMNGNRNGAPQGNRNVPPQKPVQLGPNQMINKSTGKIIEMLPPKKEEPVVEEVVVTQAPAPEEKPVERTNNSMNDRVSRDNRNGNQRFQDRNDRNERNDRNDRNGNGGNNRPFNQDRRNGDRNNGNRPSGNRPGNTPNGDRQHFGNNRGFNGAQSGTGQGNRGFNNSDRNQGRNGGTDNRFAGQRGGKSFAAEAPLASTEKHRDDQRRLNQAKDKRSRKDAMYEEKEQEIKNKNKAGRFIKPEPKAVEPEEQIKVITLPETITIKELAEKMKMQPAAIIKKLFMQGKIVTVNQEITFEDAENIAIEFDIICEQEVKVDVIEELLKEDEEKEETLVKRAPVICVMGHVDHGKTSLLDAIRKTNVTDKEAGGITQHIGAYMVNVDGQKITFLDTPGHEAFTAMRMRGANSTDIAILVVAADDGVMPQTVEAINHAKAANIEVIVAVNKIDKPNANIDRVKQELTEYGLIAEDWGGSTVFVPVSAKTGEGISDLLDMILLTADVLELKANPKRKARGLVIEAQLDKGRGPVATVLVQKGTLKVGDFISAGSSHGKVRAMIDDKGRRVKEAAPSTPVEILGLNDVPNAGEVFLAHDSDKTAKYYAETFVAQNKEKKLEETKSKMSLDDLFSQIQEGNLKELNLIVKADVQGSVEAVKQSLLKLTNEEVVVKCIHGGVGAINESDVNLAAASQAIIIGFNVRPDATAKASAEREGVDIRLYRVIYQAIEDIEAAMKGMLDPVFEEKVIGHAEVRQIFKASAVGNIAGSYILDGVFQRGCKVRISREGEQIYEGELASLKRFKDDVKEVKAGFECGLVFDGFDQMKELDIVEAYIMVEVPR
ncbi:MAG: translation initiation factor IF-2 [Lachnospiraceae bacterium]|nr:translation initiation factor IF-2 [Lachnospiraceae bacterium]